MKFFYLSMQGFYGPLLKEKNSDVKFYGLKPEFKINVHDEILSLVTYPDGNFTYTEVYELPIHLRKFYIRKLNEREKLKEKQYKSEMSNTSTEIAKPKFTNE